ncbi:MAG: hypothetical protein ABIH42_11305 [Planctomycetota bacterium]
MPESYAESIRNIVIKNKIEVASLAKIKELVVIHRQQNNLVTPDDMKLCKDSKSDKKWEHRVRSALRQLRKSGECALIDKAKYRFFISTY